MSSSLLRLLLLLSIWLLQRAAVAVSAASIAEDDGFSYQGFRGANLTLHGMAAITPEGVLRLSNATNGMKSHAFHPTPVRFKKSTSSAVFSFSTTFAFCIKFVALSGHGIVLVFSPSTEFGHATGSQFLGLFNLSSNGSPANGVVGVELDTILNPEFGDIDDNHVGIDVNGLRSVASRSAGYYNDDDGVFRSVNISSGEAMQVWVDYNGATMRMRVTLAPLGTPKPRTPLISHRVNLSSIFSESMYVGFSATTDPFRTSHYILGWSFNKSRSVALDLSAVPSLQLATTTKSGALAIWLPIALLALIISVCSGAAVAVVSKRRSKYSEVVEEWEREYGPSRFSYKTLYVATNGFCDSELLGSGGFGSVYRGVLPVSNAQIAVKRISHESRQGMREFISEIVTIGRVRHRNVVQLLGYCRRKGELMLVYEFMPNGSLDKLLFCDDHHVRIDTVHNPPCFSGPLSWEQRFRIIKGVASGLQYLHEEWEQVVIHRDVKASNVLLDDDLNGRLGDFGLARLYDHGTDPHTTHLMGTMGYLAPELARTARVTKATDVYAFGAFLLEVATGRRPIEPRSSSEEEVVLVDWVLDAWERGAVLEVADAGMKGKYPAEEVEMVVKLGLICSHPLASVRPNMRTVSRVLDGDCPCPELLPATFDLYAADPVQLRHDQLALDSCYSMSYSSSIFSSSRR